MAQALFEALAAGVAGMDSQTAMAVQSLLESQTVAEQPAQVDDEDVFQCGKCKKQFNSLSTFVSHKQNRCTPVVLNAGGAIGCMSRVINQAPSGSDGNGSFTASVTHILNKQQNLGSYNTIPQSPLTQSLGQGMVLTDDLMPFAGLEQAISNSTLQVGTNMQGNPFLSQVSNGGATCPMTTSQNFATIATQSFASGNSAFTSTIPMNPVQIQQVATPQSTLELQQVITQEGATSIGVGPPKMMTLPVVKPNATKIASPKMSVGAPNTGLITVITDLDTNTVTRQCHGGTKVDGNLLLLESSADSGGDALGAASASRKKAQVSVLRQVVHEEL
ncbi:hypothetical protein LSAT2_028365 [Lamellibrachia satsuma]|nr:hypothetical protein LSAT2_028365 [Lamellibrachia satsuma]